MDGIADPVKLSLVRRLNEVDKATIAELSRDCRASVSTTRRHLEVLVARSIVAESAGDNDGLTPGRPAARFSLAPELRVSVRELILRALE